MKHITALVLLALCLGACGEPDEPTREKPLVYTTFYPLAYFAERIGGSYVDIVCPVPPDTDPSTWMPDKKTIAAYQDADLILINGAGFEHWLTKVSLPSARVVDTTKGHDDLIAIESATTHSHGGKTHTHDGVNPHTWVDFASATSQADTVRAALVRLLPQFETALEAGFAALAKDLLALYDGLYMMPHARVWASHPSYDYLARTHQWTLHNVYLDPQTAPADVPWDALRKRLERHPATHILWEDEPRKDLAEQVRVELDLDGIVFSPCESQPAGSADYLSVMRANVKRLVEALPPPAPAVDDGLDDDRSVDELLTALDGGDEDKRSDAIRLLALRLDAATLQRDASKLLPSLTKALGDANADVSAGAAGILARMGAKAAAAVEELTAVLKRDDVMVRARAATALQEVGPQATSAASALVHLLSDPAEVVRINAAGALMKIKPDPALVLAPLAKALRSDESDEVRIHAALALGELGGGGDAAVEALQAALSDDQSEVRAAAAWALGNVGDASEKSVDALNRLLEDELVEVREAARRALDRLK